MSHIPQRKEKDCLNCGTIVHGHYCHNCGQENVVPKETFWHMVTHFLYDITHFDSKFFISIKDLLFKPGFLSKEYTMGRRASYLHPIKMYVFTSAIFFLFFFGVFKPNTNITANAGDDEVIDKPARAKLLQKRRDKLEQFPTRTYLLKEIAMLQDTTIPVKWRQLDSLRPNTQLLGMTDRDYKSFEEYDSVQQSKPANERDGWISRRFFKKVIELNNRYRNNPEEALNKLVDNILHRLPYMLFISLPLFALLLKLVYIRRKNFYYAEHGVFTIHLYVFSFIVLLVVFVLDKIGDYWESGILDLIIVLLIFSQAFYLYKAMRKFYGQRRGKTFLKFLFVAFLSLVMMLILLIIFFFFSAFTF